MSYISIGKTKCNKIPQFLITHHSCFTNGENEILPPPESKNENIQHASIIEGYGKVALDICLDFSPRAF